MSVCMYVSKYVFQAILNIHVMIHKYLYTNSDNALPAPVRKVVVWLSSSLYWELPISSGLCVRTSYMRGGRMGGLGWWI